MRTVASAVEEQIKSSPYLREAMSEQILNLSALAKKLQPTVEDSLMKPVSKGSIVIALQRLQKNMDFYHSTNPGKYLKDPSVVSGLEEITLKNNPIIQKDITAMALVPDWVDKVSVTSTDHTSIIVIAPTEFIADLKNKIGEEAVLSSIKNLSALTLQRSPGQADRVGVLFYPLQILAWNNISAVEIVTTPKSITIFIYDKDVSRAFTAIYENIGKLKNQ